MKRKIILILLLVLMLVMSGCGTQKKENWHSTEQKKYTEIVENIKKFEIGGITDELIQELETRMEWKKLYIGS